MRQRACEVTLCPSTRALLIERLTEEERLSVRWSEHARDQLPRAGEDWFQLHLNSQQAVNRPHDRKQAYRRFQRDDIGGSVSFSNDLVFGEMPAHQLTCFQTDSGPVVFKVTIFDLKRISFLGRQVEHEVVGATSKVVQKARYITRESDLAVAPIVWKGDKHAISRGAAG